MNDTNIHTVDYLQMYVRSYGLSLAAEFEASAEFMNTDWKL